MASTNIEFLATPDEIVSLVSKWASEFGLFVVAMDFFPTFRMTPVHKRLVLDSVSKSQMPRRLGFTVTPPNLDAESPYDFMLKNPEALVVDVGELIRDSLRTSALGFKSEDARILKVWRAVAGDLKKHTSAGLWANNPKTGDKAFYKQLRYTSGSKELADRGFVFLPVAGTTLLSIQEP